MYSMQYKPVMSAFLQSDGSDRQKLGEIRVRFRPGADIDLRDLDINHSVSDDSILASILSMAEITLSNSPAA